MKKNIRLIGVMLFLALALTLTLLFTACGRNKPAETTEKPETPYEVLADAIQKTAASRENGDTDLLKKALSEGSIETVFTAAGDLPIGSASPLGSFRTKSYYRENAALQTITLSNGGDSLDFSLYETSDRTTFTSSALDEAYGATYEEYAAFLEEFLIDAGESGGMTAAVAELPSLAKHFTALMEEALPLIENYADVQANLTEDDLRIALEVSSQNLAAFIRECITLAKADEDFMASLDVMLALLKAAGEVPTLDSLLEDLGINDALNEMEASNTRLTVNIVATRSRIIKRINASACDVDESEEGVIRTSEDHFNLSLLLSEEGGITIDLEGGDETLYFDYDVTDTESRRKIMLSIGVTGVTLTPVTYTYSKLDSSFTLSVAIPSAFSIECTGKLVRTDADMTATLDSLSYTDMTGSAFIDTVSLPFKGSVVIKAVDEMPVRPESYKELADLTEEEREAIVKTLVEHPLIESLLSLFSTPDIELSPDLEESLPDGDFSDFFESLFPGLA